MLHRLRGGGDCTSPVNGVRRICSGYHGNVSVGVVGGGGGGRCAVIIIYALLVGDVLMEVDVENAVDVAMLLC